MTPNYTKGDIRLQSMANAAAAKIMARGFAPHSGHKVGAAIVDERGNIHVGCNVENAHYLALHAEQAAIGAMIAQGGRSINWIAVTSAPCGACLQFLTEFANDDTRICLVDHDGAVQCIYSMSDLLPHVFTLSAS